MQYFGPLFECTQLSLLMTPASTWAARSVSPLERLSTGFDKQAGIHPEATTHGERSDEKDVKYAQES